MYPLSMFKRIVFVFNLTFLASNQASIQIAVQMPYKITRYCLSLESDVDTFG